MITRYDAAINGTWLSEISDSILVTDVREEEPQMRLSTAGKAVGDGSRFVRNQRQSLSVSVAFVIWEQDVERRKHILMQVQSWAMGAVGRVGYLEVNDRRGQRLNVRVDALPALSSALRYQEEIRITFTAYELPFWMAVTPTKETIDESGLLYVDGTGEALCDVEVENTSSTVITRVQVNAGMSSMVFEDISLPPAEKLILVYDDFGFLSARIGSTSVLAKRTAESDDDLLVQSGDYNTILIFADGAVSAQFKARGVFL